MTDAIKAAAATRRTTIDIARIKAIFPLSILAKALGDRRRHLVGRLDHLGVHFVGALGGDQLGDLLDGIDVGALQIALMDLAEAGIAGNADDRRAGGDGLVVEIAAERIEARLVGEVGERELAQLRGVTSVSSFA